MRCSANPGTGWAACIALAILAAPVYAHHGTSEFDPHREITLHGTVARFVFSNPHVQIFFDVIGSEQETVSWQGELPAPNTLTRVGWNRRTLQPGDRVTINGFQAWRGEHSVWVRTILGPGGRPLPLSSH